MKRLNRRGIVLIASYIVVIVFLTLGVAFYLTSIQELNNAKRYNDSTAAFWLCEAGMNEAVYNLRLDPSWTPSGTVNLGDGIYTIQLSDAEAKIITVTATVNNIQRRIQAKMPYINSIFNNTISSGGDLFLSGAFARLEVYGQTKEEYDAGEDTYAKTRLSGVYIKQGIGVSGVFDPPIEEGVSSELTTITYPDADENGTADQFNDFVEYNRDIVASYDPSEVVYIQTDNTVNVFPNSSLIGKKILYVEGSSPDTGDVNIFFDTTWQDGEDLTVISTGTIDYVQPLQFQQDARLSTISWDEYHEYAIFLSTHDGVNYAHDEAKYYDIFGISVTEGNIIANQGMSCTEIIALKRFYFSDRIENGDLPPGFEGLFGSAPTLITDPQNWKEL